MKVVQTANNINNQTPPRKHAVVMGGSMAGLLTARVLADHFEKVTLLERDIYPAGTDHRRGQPQSHHLHALLARGLKIIEELFPGIRNELIQDGAIMLESGSDLYWYTPAGVGKTFISGVMFIAFSRPFLDWHVRRRLSEVKNVEILDNREVTALVTNGDRNAISGVSVKRYQTSEAEVTLPNEFIKADLIVDATGRHSRAPQWLTTLGYEAPRETVVNAFLGYATRIYEHTDSQWKAIFLQAAPPKRTRGGIIFPIEDDRWMLTLVGGGGDYPPANEDNFLKFTESLPSPIIADTIRNAKPLSAIRTFRTTENRLRHYDELAQLPGKFVLLGDSVCAFNPVYGQGMTIAAMGALELGNFLSESRKSDLGSEFVRKFQKRLAKLNVLPWTLATGEDCRYPSCQGASRTLKVRFMHAYLDRVIALTTWDTSVRSIWLNVFQMLLPPGKLFSPPVLFKVIREFIAPRKSAKPRARVVARRSPMTSPSGEY